jgi:hypothetical protein
MEKPRQTPHTMRDGMEPDWPVAREDEPMQNRKERRAGEKKARAYNRRHFGGGSKR